MRWQILRFVLCYLILVVISHAIIFLPFLRELERAMPYADKYEHALAGVLLVVGFFDVWKSSASRVFILLILHNLAWEGYEIWLAYKSVWLFDWIPFDQAWAYDNIADIIVTMSSGMLCYWFFIKRKK